MLKFSVWFAASSRACRISLLIEGSPSLIRCRRLVRTNCMARFSAVSATISFRMASIALSVIRPPKLPYHSRTSYSNATPSESFSLNHSSASSGVANLEVIDVANLCSYRRKSKRSSLATCGQRCGHFAFTRNRERPSAMRRRWARALTAFTVRPRSAAMSMTEALEMMSCRSRSSSPEVYAFALFNFFVSVSPGPGHLNPSNEPGRVALVCRIVSLRALTAFIATHPGAELIERHGAEHREPLVEHLERHPDRSLAAFAANPRVALGLELGNRAVVCHLRIKPPDRTRKQI